MNRPFILGAASALATIAIGVGALLAVAQLNGADASNGSSTDVAASGSKSSKSSTTTSTAAPHGGSTTTTKAPSTTTTKAPSAAAGGGTAAPVAPPTTTTTVDTEVYPEDAYHPIALPSGVSAAITTCNWSAANGGELQATGTITSTSSDDEVWLVTAVWLHHNVSQDEEIDEQTDVYDLDPSQSLSWRLTISAPTAPPNLSCALELL